jgi:hypothetical protein
VREKEKSSVVEKTVGRREKEGQKESNEIHTCKRKETQRKERGAVCLSVCPSVCVWALLQCARTWAVGRRSACW